MGNKRTRIIKENEQVMIQEIISEYFSNVKNLNEIDIYIKKSLTKSKCSSKYIEDFLLQKNIYEKIQFFLESYLKTRRDSISTFIENFNKTYAFFEALDLTPEEILKTLVSNNKLIHLANEEILYKLFMINRLQKEGEDSIIKQIIVNRPRELITGPDTAYARIKILENKIASGTLKFRGDNPFTIATILHCSASEFQERFCENDQLYSDDQETKKQDAVTEFLEKHPFYVYGQNGERHMEPSILKELITWPGNQELLQKFYGKDKIV